MPIADRGHYFYANCVCIFWIVTQGGINDDAFTRHYLDVSNHFSIRDGKRNLICVLSKEALERKLEVPPAFATYEPLRENDQFVEPVAATCENIEKLLLL